MLPRLALRLLSMWVHPLDHPFGLLAAVHAHAVVRPFAGEFAAATQAIPVFQPRLAGQPIRHLFGVIVVAKTAHFVSVRIEHCPAFAGSSGLKDVHINHNSR